MKTRLLSVFVCLLALTSCELFEIDKEETPGEIPGMGNAGGSLEVISEFEIPEGIEIAEIRGSADDLFFASAAETAILKDEGDSHEDDGDHEDGEEHEGGCNGGSDHKGGQEEKCEHGSGGQWVSLDLCLTNTTEIVKEINFPAGTVFECEADGAQNGITLTDVLIRINGKGSVNIKLNLYCLNHGKEGSDVTLVYQVRGITSSQLMGHLTTKLEGKKIDIVYFREDPEAYAPIIEKIQYYVWQITNENGIDENGWAFIEAIQDLAN